MNKVLSEIKEIKKQLANMDTVNLLVCRVEWIDYLRENNCSAVVVEICQELLEDELKRRL